MIRVSRLKKWRLRSILASELNGGAQYNRTNYNTKYKLGGTTVVRTALLQIYNSVFTVLPYSVVSSFPMRFAHYY